MISATLSFITVLSLRKWLTRKCVLKWVFSASVFIFFHNWWVVNCMKDVHKHNFMIIKRWSNFWCKLIFILHLYIMNWIFSLLNAKFIVVNWLWVFLVIVFNSSNNFNLMFITMFSRISITMWWIKHLLSSQCKWCRLKSFTINCLQSSLINSFKWEIVNDSSMKMIDSEHKL